MDLGVDGYLNWSSDEKQVTQFRLDGFSFNRLRPYTGWETCYPEVMRRWAFFRERVRPTQIRRVAVRFINSIEIPLKTFDLDEYLVNAPRAPELPSAVVAQFVKQVTFAIPERNARGTITQTIGQTNSPTATPILFDLEVAVEINALINDDEIAKVLANLRTLKNELFERSLQPKAKELFK